jgi:hypothetical protein
MNSVNTANGRDKATIALNFESEEGSSPDPSLISSLRLRSINSHSYLTDRYIQLLLSRAFRCQL